MTPNLQKNITGYTFANLWPYAISYITNALEQYIIDFNALPDATSYEYTDKKMKCET